MGLNKNYIDFSDRSLRSYMKDISAIDLITPEKERLLFEKKNGTKEEWTEAKKKIAEGHQRFVVSVASKFKQLGVPLSDLINAGNIGFMKSIENYDDSFGAKLISYAVWDIKQKIRSEIKMGRVITLPDNKINDIRKVKKMNEVFYKKEGRNLSFDDIDIVSNNGKKIDDRTVDELKYVNQGVSSLDDKISFNGNNVLLDVIIDNDEKLPDSCLNEESDKKLVEVLLLGLSEKHRDIFECRFGLNGKKEMSYDSISERHSLSRERIRQIVERTIEKMNKRYKKNGMSQYV